MRTHASLALSLFAIATFAGCGDDDRRPPETDGGRDSSMPMVDGSMPMTDGSMPMMDGSMPMDDGSTPDGGDVDGGDIDAGVDSGIDGGADGGTDGGTDAGTDGGTTCYAMDLGTATGVNVATGSTASASDDYNGTCRATGGGVDMALRWEAPSTGSWTIDTLGSSFDTVLYVRAGDDCAGAEAACNDDIRVLVIEESRVRIAATAGDVFTIFVDGYDDSELGDFDVSITQAPLAETNCTDSMDGDRDGDTDCDDSDCATLAACVETMCMDTTDNDGDGDTDCADADCFTDPACDSCPDATTSATGTAVATGSTTGGTNHRSGSCGGSASNEATVGFTAPSTGAYTFTTAGSSFDTVLYVLDGGCTGFELGCNDDVSTGDHTSTLTLPLGMGQTVTVVIDAYGGGNGDWDLNITSAAMTYAGPAAGDVVITEIMNDPTTTEPTHEWFEVYNTSSSIVNLNGCVVTDAGTNTFTVGRPVLVASHGYAVFAQSSAPGGFSPTYVYGGSTTLANADDEIIVTCGGTEIDRVEYDGGPLFPDPTGHSISLDPDFSTATDNDSGANWCAAPTSAGAYDHENFGTPGFENPDCP